MTETPPETKQCPYCAETILAAAIVCKHCGRDLTGTGAGAVAVLPPKKKSNPGGLFLFLALLALVVGWFACRGSGSSGGSVNNPPVKSTYSVKYEVSGSPVKESASLTYENETGNTEQKDVTMPWTETFTAAPGDFLYVSAQIDGNGTITCKIYLDGVVWQEATSRGEFVIASCSGSAGSND